MPMLNETTALMSARLSSANIVGSASSAEMFAALPLPAEFVYPNDRRRRELLQNYLDSLPLGIQESLRATIYFALTNDPPKPVAFMWAGAYDYKLEIHETFDTYKSPRTAGVIGIVLHGRYPDDPHPLGDRIQPPEGKSSSKRSAKGSPKPAKRKASKKS